MHRCSLCFCCQLQIATGISVGMQLDEHVPDHKEFISQCPVIANIAKASRGYWPEDLRELLQKIVEVCSAPFLVAPANQEEPAVATNLSFWQEGHWYPHWERIRKGKRYPNYHTAVPDAIDGLYGCIDSYHGTNRMQDKQDGRSILPMQAKITRKTGIAGKQSREQDLCGSLYRESL